MGITITILKEATIDATAENGASTPLIIRQVDGDLYELQVPDGVTKLRALKTEVGAAIDILDNTVVTPPSVVKQVAPQRFMLTKEANDEAMEGDAGGNNDRIGAGNVLFGTGPEPRPVQPDAGAVSEE